MNHEKCSTPSPRLMDRSSDYSFWLQPQGKTYKKLKNLIYDLAEKYSAPKFEPHVTLLGNLFGKRGEIIAKSRELANRIKPYRIRLNEPGSSNRYYRCVFARAEKTNPVMQANEKAREIFKRENEEPYMPHLSLLYGNFSQEIKDKIIASIGKSFELQFNVDRIFLTNSSNTVPIKDWLVAEEFKLG